MPFVRSEKRPSPLPRLPLEPPAFRVNGAGSCQGAGHGGADRGSGGHRLPVALCFVAAESAEALVPGETSLIVAAALASQGKLSFPLVVVVAAGAAIVGDNIGYLIGRRGLRRLVDRPGRWAAGRRQLIEGGEEFFARRGSAAVFFGRWLPGLRVVTSWLAGAERMPWPRFLLWNALGGIAWASTIGALAYVLGRSASGSLGAIGFIGIGVAVLVYVITRVRRWRLGSRKPPAGRQPR